MHKHYGYVQISQMKYGYVKYTDQLRKANIWGKEQVRNVFEKSGYGTSMGKVFFKRGMGTGTNDGRSTF